MKRISRLSGWLTVVVAMFAVQPQLNADVIAADNFDGGFVSSGFFTGIGYENPPSWTNEMAGQRFRSDITGTLTTIETSVDVWQGGESLIVSIHQANGNLPGTSLGTMTFAESGIADNVTSQLTTLDLSSLDIGLQESQDYVVTFGVATPLFQTIRYRAVRTDFNVNSFGYGTLFSRNGGATWETSSSPDEVGVRVFAIPEPGVVPSVLLLMTGMAGLRHRRQ